MGQHAERAGALGRDQLHPHVRPAGRGERRRRWRRLNDAARAAMRGDADGRGSGTMIRAHSGWVRAGGRWLAAALLAAAALAGARGDALAHANFARSDPPPNAVLAASPARLRVWFT